MNNKPIAISVSVVLIIGSFLALANVTSVQSAEPQPGQPNLPLNETHAVLLLVESTVLPQLGTAYAAFKADLVREGFTVLEQAVHSSTQPPETKTTIQGYWADPAYTLDGVILIGNLKAPYFWAIRRLAQIRPFGQSIFRLCSERTSTIEHKRSCRWAHSDSPIARVSRGDTSTVKWGVIYAAKH